MQISVLPSCKIVKLKYLIGEEILPSGESRIKEQAKFTYFPLYPRPSRTRVCSLMYVEFDLFKFTIGQKKNIYARVYMESAK